MCKGWSDKSPYPDQNAKRTSFYVMNFFVLLKHVKAWINENEWNSLQQCSVMDLKLFLLFYAEQVVSLAADCMIPQRACIIGY